MAQYQAVELPSRLPLIVPLSSRGSTTHKDAKLVNCYMELTEEGELYIIKRPGLAIASAVAAGMPGRGAYFWKGSMYAIFGPNLFKDNVIIKNDLENTGGVYRFDSILGATPKLIIGNGKAAYTVTEAGIISATLHSINVEYPSETVKGFAYLGGYSFVMQPQAVIWGSALNSVDQPGDWDPLNFIRAQIEPDEGVALAKQLVYVVAFKEWSTEFFFLSDNPTGSPLGQVQGMKVAYGCASADSVRSIDDILFWLCTNRNASLQIMSMDQGATTVVSTPAVDRLLENVDTSVVHSWNLKITGHSFYVISFPESDLTLAYDITYQQWMIWTDHLGRSFHAVDATYDAQGRHILQHATDGRLYYCNTIYTKDVDNPIEVNIVTPIFDAGVRRRKHLTSMEVIADQVQGSVLQMRCNDADYREDSWTQWRQVDLSVRRPMIWKCGTFYKRAYHLRHRSDTPFRIQALELQYDLGTL